MLAVEDLQSSLPFTPLQPRSSPWPSSRVVNEYCPSPRHRATSISSFDLPIETDAAGLQLNEPNTAPPATWACRTESRPARTPKAAQPLI